MPWRRKRWSFGTAAVVALLTTTKTTPLFALSLSPLTNNHNPPLSSSSSSPSSLLSLSSATTLVQKKNANHNHKILLRAAAIARSVDWLLVDVENVRGRAPAGSFARYSHTEFVNAMGHWVEQGGLLDGRVSLIVDHGQQAAAYWLAPRRRRRRHGAEEQEEEGGMTGMAIVFAGPREKADDVMARACCSGKLDHAVIVGNNNDNKKKKKVNNIMIVTADTELIRRCRGARVMDPRQLWDDLEVLQAAQHQHHHRSDNDLVPFLTSRDNDDDNDDRIDDKDANANHLHDQQRNDDDTEENNSALLSSQLHWAAKNNNSSSTTTTRQLIDEEIRRSAQLLQAESMLRSLPKQTNNKRKKSKLQARVNHLREQLALWQHQSQQDNGGQSLLDAILHSSATASSSLDRDGIVAQWEQWRRISPRRRREYTGDRLILAEALRQKCQAFLSSSSSLRRRGDDDPNDIIIGRRWLHNYPAAAAHVWQVNHHQQQGRNSPRGGTPPPPPTEVEEPQLLPPPKEHCVAVKAAATTAATISLRLVVISDTHGLEEQLPNPLPPGDVLLHLGDFTADGETGRSVRHKLDDFGTWMAVQPYATKLVVRGNHDPRDWRPPTDDITYVTKYTQLSIQGFDFVLLPHGAAANVGVNGNKSIVSSANNAMIVASHVPPLGLLDRTLSGENVGSRNWLRHLQVARPALWLCGHIHEGRGCVQVTTGRRHDQTTTTMVVNAANANDGPAERLDHGPVSLQLTRSHDSSSTTNSYRENRATTTKTTTVETLSGNLRQYAQLVTDAQSNEDFFPLTTKTTSGCNAASVKKTELLLAVDLGLKNTGISLFSQKGQLLRYTQHSSTTLERLRQDMAMLMEEWEDSANAADQTITRIAVEGADVALRNMWRDLAAQDEQSSRSLLFVKAEQWRAELLIPREKTSRDQLKAAARAIARQVILDYSIDGQAHSGKIQTDVADSLCTGLYVARRLGWIVRDKAVRRYSNGRVIV